MKGALANDTEPDSFVEGTDDDADDPLEGVFRSTELVLLPKEKGWLAKFAEESLAVAAEALPVNCDSKLKEFAPADGAGKLVAYATLPLIDCLLIPFSLNLASGSLEKE